MGHPVRKLVHGGPVSSEQIRENRARMREKKLLPRGFVGKQTNGNRRSFRLVVGLRADGPVGAAIILRIEHPVAAFLIEELADVLAVGIKDDGDFFARFDLINDLPNQSGFAGSGVAGDLNMMRLAIAFENEIFAAPARLQQFEKVARILNPEPQSIASGLPVKAPAAGQSSPAQAPSVAGFEIVPTVEPGSGYNESN